MFGMRNIDSEHITQFRRVPAVQGRRSEVRGCPVGRHIFRDHLHLPCLRHSISFITVDPALPRWASHFAPAALMFRRGMKMNCEADKSKREPRPSRSGWRGFFDLVDQMEVPDDFLRDRGDAPSQERDLF